MQVIFNATQILIHIIILPQPGGFAVADNLLGLFCGDGRAVDELTCDCFEEVAHKSGVVESEIEAGPIDVGESNIRHRIVLIVRGVLEIQVNNRCVICNEFDKVENKVPQDDADEN